MTAKVSVVIPNWNGAAHLKECFGSLDRQTFQDFEVVFVDNASTDDSVGWVRQHQPEASVIVLPENEGFSAAVNAGIATNDSEYVALLNNDTAVTPQWLSALVDAMESNPDYDFAASKMLLYSQRDSVNAAGDVYSLCQMAGKHRGFRRPAERYQDRARVFGACAGAAIYRRSMFDDIGVFDERFFLNSEDTDLNLRALLSGKRCLYVPDAVVYHKHGATIGARPSWRIRRLSFRNEAAAVHKNWPSPLLPLAYVCWPYRMLRGLLPLNPRAWRFIPENVSTIGDRIRAEAEGRRMGLASRREVQALKRVGTATMVRWMLKGSSRL